MLYVADLHRKGLLKIGVTARGEGERRRSELRRVLQAPRLEYTSMLHIPSGWGPETEWERRLLACVRRYSSRLQLFSAAEVSEEVVDATPADAHRELRSMLRETEVDPHMRAKDLCPDRVDWRFANFLHRSYPECRDPSDGYWKDVTIRLTFLYSLRGEPIARWERLNRGFSCAEADDVCGLVNDAGTV